MFGTTMGMDNSKNAMSIYTFGEAFSNGTLLEEEQEFSYETYLRSLEDSQKELNSNPQSQLLKEFMAVAYHQEIPTSFDQLDTFKLHSSEFDAKEMSKLNKSIKAIIAQKACKKWACTADEYFNDLRNNIYHNRSKLIDALKHGDKKVIATFKNNRQDNPWHLVHILPMQEWDNYKTKLEKTLTALPKGATCCQGTLTSIPLVYTPGNIVHCGIKETTGNT